MASRAATAVLLAGACLIGLACTSSSPDESSSPSSTETSAPREPEVPTGTRFDQSEALDDGVVSDEELGSALAQAAECLRELGVPVDDPPAIDREERGDAWAPDLPDTAEARAAWAACRTATFGQLELPYLVGSGAEGPTLAEREATIRACLRDAGVDVGERSLSEMLTTVDLNVVAACSASD